MDKIEEAQIQFDRVQESMSDLQEAMASLDFSDRLEKDLRIMTENYEAMRLTKIDLHTRAMSAESDNRKLQDEKLKLTCFYASSRNEVSELREELEKTKRKQENYAGPVVEIANLKAEIVTRKTQYTKLESAYMNQRRQNGEAAGEIRDLKQGIAEMAKLKDRAIELTTQQNDDMELMQDVIDDLRLKFKQPGDTDKRKLRDELIGFQIVNKHLEKDLKAAKRDREKLQQSYEHVGLMYKEALAGADVIHKRRDAVQLKTIKERDELKEEVKGLLEKSGWSEGNKEKHKLLSRITGFQIVNEHLEKDLKAAKKKHFSQKFRINLVIWISKNHQSHVKKLTKAMKRRQEIITDKCKIIRRMEESRDLIRLDIKAASDRVYKKNLENEALAYEALAAKQKAEGIAKESIASHRELLEARREIEILRRNAQITQ